MSANNENDEEIPAVTVKTDEEYAQIVENLRWRPTFYKIAQFFIVDLLRAEKVEDASYFRFKNVDFKTVLIKGTVVGVGDMATRLLITVDDGTAQIDCIFQPNEKLKILKQKVNEALNVLCDESQEEKDKGTIILLSRCKHKLKTAPIYNCDINLGDTVELIGNLSEFYENRTIYIKYIKNCDASTEINHLEHLFELYEGYYDE